ncbi:MAG TPA: FHA domain-containing protein [Acetobacteraceae bacterium]
MHAQRDVVRFLSAYRETWHRFFADLQRRGQWHLVSHLCGRGRHGASVAELSGLVKQVFLLDDATVRERLGELYRLGFCTVDPPDRPVSARTLVVPTPLLTAKFDAHLIEMAGHLLRPTQGVPPSQIDQETRRHLLRAIECCNDAWMAAMERTFDVSGLSMARRLEAKRHLLSPSHQMLVLIALQSWYGMISDDEGEGVLADDMAAELLRLLRQNFQTTRDHIGYLVQLGLLERRTGRALRVALPEPVAAELDRSLTSAGHELTQIAAMFPGGEADVEKTGISRPRPGVAPPDTASPSHLLIVSRDGEPERCVALADGPLIVGRAPSSGLMLDATEVSRAHCRIVIADGALLATDLDSTNGTFVDGKRITHPTPLLAGAVLQVGPYRITYRQDSPDSVDGTLRTMLAAAAGAPQRAGRRRQTS